MSKTDLELYFEFKCWKGLEKRGRLGEPEYRERLQYEIDIIEQMKYPGYFLIVADFIQWAKRQDILVGGGRGSGSGSLVAYCLEITDGIDPLEYDLIFERFLNPERISMPDIDVDFEKEKRDLVIEYVAQKYGADKVTQIGTYGTMQAKQAIQKVCAALGYPVSMGEKLRKLCLPAVHGKPQPLEASIKKVKKLGEFAESPGPEGKILRWAQKFEGRVANVGVHASGVVISDGPVYERMPLYVAKNKSLATQWEMNTVEECGLIKFDFLGLMTLSKIRMCLDFIMARHGKKIDINKIDVNDIATYQFLQKGRLLGVFQLETSSGMRDLVMQVRPQNLRDLAAIVAIFRPGPLQSEGLKDYLAWRNGAPPKYLVPQFEPILRDTGGFCVFQEQIMQIAQQCAGYSMAEADLLRKAMGKKKTKILKAERERFRTGWIKNGLPRDKFDTLWEQLLGFSDYAFNRAHAATYAFLAYQTAWLKTHYPVEYMTACMAKDFNNTDQMIKYLGECERMGLAVLPPDINQSKEYFTIVDDKTIRYGLIPVRNIGAKPASEIILKRMRAPGGRGYRDLPHFCEAVNLTKVNRMKVESLVRAGAFDSLGHNRASLLDWIERYWAYRSDFKSYESKLNTWRKRDEAYHERMRQIEEGAKLKPLKQWERPEAPPMPELTDIPELPANERQIDEHTLMGLFFSGHPLEEFSGRYDTIELLRDLDDGSYVSMMGLLVAIKEHTIARTRKLMAFAIFEDLTGRIEATIFASTYQKIRNKLQPLQPLLIHAKTEVIETDEGERIAKLIVEDVEVLETQPKDVDHPTYKLVVPASRVGELQKFVGSGKYKAIIDVEFASGMHAKINTPVKVMKSKRDMQKTLDLGT